MSPVAPACCRMLISTVASGIQGDKSLINALNFYLILILKADGRFKKIIRKVDLSNFQN